MRWFWIPEWDLPPDAQSRQELLPFPSCNLVVQPEEVTVAGPATRCAERVLSGTGWAVGALLLPASVPALGLDPAAHRDAEHPYDAPGLRRRVVAAMTDLERGGGERRTRAAESFAQWIRERVPPPAENEDGALANRLAALLADPAITRADQLPPLLQVSPRTLQRLAERCFGLSLHSMIRRRRLQEGAERLRQDPALGIAALAGELGYADHAHFTSDFKAVLGVTPSAYRERARVPLNPPTASRGSAADGSPR